MTGTYDELIKLWDIQQEFYHKYRDERYEAMFDLLEISGKKKFRIIDLAAGPGSLSFRFLKRFPGSESVMVDQDPVLLKVSKEIFKDPQGTVSWKAANITDATWVKELEAGSFDAVMSTTALHWLDESHFKKICEHSHLLLRDGGIFVNGDTIHAEHDGERFDDLEERVRKMNEDKFPEEKRFDWDSFWDLVRKIPELKVELEQRDAIYPPGSSHGHTVSLQKQTEILLSMGFNVLGVVWSRFSDRVLAAIK